MSKNSKYLTEADNEKLAAVAQAVKSQIAACELWLGRSLTMAEKAYILNATLAHHGCAQ